MYKIDDIEIENYDDVSNPIANLLVALEFKITVKRSNSKQLNSDIDYVIEDKLTEIASKVFSKKERVVWSHSEKVGELDIAFTAKTGKTYFIEIEKSNKKTIWFDYIKLLTMIQNYDNSFGILICPKNYAYKIGTWDLFQEAKNYKSHLERVFQSPLLNRIYIIGYTQYMYHAENWVEFSPEVVSSIKSEF